VPCDKLVLRNHRIRSRFLDLAQQKGHRETGYSHVIDLSRISRELPVILYSGCYYSGDNKIVFRDVAHLGYTRCKEIAAEIFHGADWSRVMRVDWCLDVGIPLRDLALYCRLGGVQRCTTERSRTGTTYYLQRSDTRTLFLYDKRAQLEARKHPILREYIIRDPWTRIEIQFKSNLPFRRFDHLGRYAELDLLANLSIWDAGLKREGLKPIEELAAEGLLRKIDEVGLQVALKQYSSQTAAYLMKRFFQPAPESKFPDLNGWMRRSVQDWLDDRIRFPRFPRRGLL